MRKIPAHQLYDYILIAARVWLAYILLSYGWGKLTDTQFGITETELNTPVKNLDLFRLSWYLADHEPFKSFIGIAQIITGILLFFRRTCIIGAFMAIPIWLNILVWDMTFMHFFGIVFTVRLSYYLLLTVLILLHYRHRVLPALRLSIQQDKPRYHYPVWAYVCLPVAGFIIEFIPGIPRMAGYLTGHH